MEGDVKKAKTKENILDLLHRFWRWTSKVEEMGDIVRHEDIDTWVDMNMEKFILKENIMDINETKDDQKSFKFYSTDQKRKLMIQITEEHGIQFNHEEFPNLTPDDFAKAFCDCLEKEFIVTLEKRVKVV